jgi:tetratricopeptide (TPR) repeat protein
LVRRAGGRGALQGKTTGWLKHNHVKPATAATAGPYSLLLEPPLTGPATVFLSHAYDYAFLDVVDAAAAFEAAQPPPVRGERLFFYFDLLVVDQHAQAAEVSYEDLSREFGRSARTIGRMAFVLSFDAPVSLSRSWCIFEAAQMLSGAPSSFSVVMPPRDEAAFTSLLCRDFESIVQRMCSVEVERARAEKDADRANIARVIREDLGGFSRVNQLVIGALREWMTAAGRAALALVGPPPARARSALQLAIARFLVLQARLRDAAALYEEALAARREVVVEREAAAATAAAAAAGAGGGADAAAAVAAAAAAATEARDDMAAVARALGDVLWRLQRPLEAVALCREAVDHLRARHGDRHPNTLGTISTLACALDVGGELAPAEPLYLEAIAGRIAVLGAAHPDTLTTQSNYGGLLTQMNRFAEASALNAAVLRARRAALGCEHPDTLRSLDNLAFSTFREGWPDVAEPMFREALAARRKVLGQDHLSTLASAQGLAALLLARGAFGEALALAEAALQGRREALGEVHKAVEESKAVVDAARAALQKI